MGGGVGRLAPTQLQRSRGESVVGASVGRWIAVGRQFSHLHIGTLARWYVGTLARWHVVTSAHRFVNHPYPFLRSRGIQFAHSHEQMHPTVRLLRPVFDGPRNDGRLGGGFYASLPLIDSSNATAVICSTPRNPFSPEGEFSSHQISLAHG